MKGKVTLRSVEALQPREKKDSFLWDQDLPGYGVRITPQGVRSYVFQYEAAGRSRRLTIGRHNAPWTPGLARKEALRLRGEVAAGRDPAEEGREARDEGTLAEFAERYLNEHAATKKKPRSLAEDRRLLTKNILPKFGRRKLSDIRRADVAKLHDSLRERPYLANRVLALLSKMMNLAERVGLRPDGSNPCRHVQKYKEQRRERFLSEKEMAKLGQVLATVEKDDSVPWQAVAAIRLLLFTGCRKSEILNLRWEDVDAERGRLVLGDSKTGAQVLPLSPPALEVLSELPRVDGNPYCLPGRGKEKPFVGLPKIWYEIRRRAGLDDVRLHDLRHSYASIAASDGESLVIIGGLLGHRQAATTARYAHLADDPLKSAADRIAGRIAEALRRRPEKGAKVLPMKRAKKT